MLLSWESCLNVAQIYKIENDINDKVYIGQTTQGIRIRYRQHLDKVRDTSDHTRLHSAMRELGVEHFSCVLLEECNELDLDNREKYWINYFDSYNNGYNMTSGGNGGSVYQINDAEVIQMWDSGLPLSKIAEKFDCSVKAISGRLSEYPNYSPEEAMKRGSVKQVHQYDLAGMYIKAFESASDAEAILNGEEARNRDNIAACARGEQHTAYGYYWSYEKLEKGPVLYTIKGITCPIVQYSKKGEQIATYATLAEAERAMMAQGHKRPHISEVCQRRPKYNTSCGYVWRYLYDEEINKPLQSSVAELATLLDD